MKAYVIGPIIGGILGAIITGDILAGGIAILVTWGIMLLAHVITEGKIRL